MSLIRIALAIYAPLIAVVLVVFIARPLGLIGAGMAWLGNRALNAAIRLDCWADRLMFSE